MLVFPNNPNPGDVFAPGPGFPSWMWDGDKWTRAAAAPFALEALADVTVTDPQHGQVLEWDGGAERWLNATLPPPPAYTLAGLADVAITAPLTDGKVLTWDAATAHWVNRLLPAPPDLSTLAGPVTITTQTSPGFSVQVGETGGAWEQIKITNSNSVGGVLYRAQDASGNTASFGLNSNAEGSIRTNNIDRIIVTQAGAVTINAPSALETLTTYGRLDAWTTVINGNPMGLLNRGRAVFQPPDGSTNNITFETDGSAYFNGTTSIGYNLIVNGGTSYWVGVPFVGYTAGWASQIWGFNSNGTGSIGSVDSSYSWDPNGNPRFMFSAPNMTGPRDNRIMAIVAPLGTHSGLDICCGYTSDGAYDGRTGNDGYILRLRANSSSGGSRDYFLMNMWGYLQLPNLPVLSGYANNARIEPSYGSFLSVTTSSARYKLDMKTLPRARARELFARLRPITFKSNPKLCYVGNEPDRIHYGLVAEEVAAIDPALADYDADGQPMGVDYQAITMLLIPLVRELLGLPELGGA